MTTIQNAAHQPIQRFPSQLAADKAIIVMALLRATKRPDQKGVGANREDWPMFAEVADKIVAGKEVEKETMFQARHRVQKYYRQVNDSVYRDRVLSQSYGFNEVVKAYADATKQVLAVRETIIQEMTEKGYGDW